jgi:methylglutaconyl-CoA hydratase
LLKISEEKQILTVSLDRADARNAFNAQMISELTKIFKKISQRKDLRAIVLRGEGKVFCAGADLDYMKSMAKFSLAQNKADSVKLFDMFAAIESCPVPVVGFIHGAAFGGALGLMAVCDFVVIEANTQMCFSEVKLGLVPAVISPFILKKCVPGVMRPLMMTGKVFFPHEILQSGLIHQVGGAQDLELVLSQFLSAGPEALIATKKLTRSLASKAAATKVIAERRVSKEGQEGLKSFFEKRKPSWSLK